MERHSIELVEGARVLKDRPYPISPAKQKLVEDKIDKMLSRRWKSGGERRQGS